MSSRSKRSKKPPSSSYYPTLWTEWEWNETLGCNQRYRLKAENEYEYDYDQQAQSEAQPPADPRTGQISFNSIPESSGPYSKSINYTADSLTNITVGLSQVSLGPRITTRNPTTDREEFDPHYKVHKGWEFKWGRVFKVLWAEPSGNDTGNDGSDPGTMTVRKDEHGDQHFQKVRRFVIINAMAGHCICLPINTYSMRGVTKNGVHGSHHTIIYSDKKPVYFKGEKSKGLTKEPIKMNPSSPRHKLADSSRLNYAKPYTVEYNVKVWFIGKIDPNSEWQLSTDYNNVHPPLETRGVPPAREDTYAFAEGGTADPVPQGTTQPWTQRSDTTSAGSQWSRTRAFSPGSQWGPGPSTSEPSYSMGGSSWQEGSLQHEQYTFSPRADENTPLDTLAEDPEDQVGLEGEQNDHLGPLGDASQHGEYDENAEQEDLYNVSDDETHPPGHPKVE